MTSAYQTKCPSCSWSVNIESPHAPGSEMRLCACCGDSYKAEWVLSGDEPPQTSATSSEKTAEGTKRRMFQLIDSRSWAIGLAIAGGLGFVAMAWPQLATSFKRAQYLEQIQPLMKSMTELSIATEDGLTMRKYRDLLLKVKVDYEDTDRFGLMGVFRTQPTRSKERWLAITARASFGTTCNPDATRD